MNLLAEYLSENTLIAGWLILLAILMWVVKTAPWYKLKDKESQHVLLAMAVVVFLIWQFAATLNNGYSFHFLLMTLVTLMFGPQFAILTMLFALVGVVWQLDLGWMAFGINAILMGLVPIAITWWLYRLGAKFLEANFFVYLFYNGFLSAAVGIVVSLALASWVLLVNEVATYEELKHGFIVYIPLMATPEGFVNAMLLMVLIFLKPQWVATFYEDKYMKGK